MGIDLLMDIALFYVIWRFLWKKSRNKHMARKGRSSAMDSIYFIVFVTIFVGSMLIVGTNMGAFGIFAPFYVIGAIVVAYWLTVRVTFFVPLADASKTLDAGRVSKKRWIGGRR